MIFINQSHLRATIAVVLAENVCWSSTTNLKTCALSIVGFDRLKPSTVSMMKIGFKMINLAVKHVSGTDRDLLHSKMINMMFC